MRKLTSEEREELIRNYAYRWYEIRMKYGEGGNEKTDWERVEKMVDTEHYTENPHYGSTPR